MYKYLILDMGYVLVGPTTGDWFVTPTYMKNVNLEKVNVEEVMKLFQKYGYMLDGKVETLEEEYEIFKCFHKKIFDELGYNIPEKNIENIARDFVYDENNNKYFVYKDTKEQLERLSKQYTLLMLSDNWPDGEEYLKKHDLYKYFKKVYISSVYPAKKIDKVFFDYPINEFDIKKGEALFVDDREELLDVGVEKGLDVVLMDRNKRIKESKYTVINSLEELLNNK